MASRCSQVRTTAELTFLYFDASSGTRFFDVQNATPIALSHRSYRSQEMSALRSITPAQPETWGHGNVADATTIHRLEAQLSESVEGEVRFDSGSKALYAVDSSNYRQIPVGVVLPKSVDDVVNAIAACKQFDVPVLSRGGGTSLAGQCCNTAVVIDWSKYLGQILNIDPVRKQATVHPGCVLDNLRNAAGKYGL